MKELWKDIVGYEGMYQVSNTGKVKSAYEGCGRKKGSLLKGVNRGGYLRVTLTNSKRQSQTFTIHRLVLLTFLDNPERKLEVNHKDGQKSHNCLHNLEWATRLENQRHAIKLGLVNNSGENNVHSVLTKDDVLAIRKIAQTGHVNNWTNTKKTHKEIGKEYGISDRAVCEIANNKTYVYG